MARPLAFDPNVALDAAVECFWQHGMAAASMRDIASRMGIGAPSLYNTFGDKRALFLAALERYATVTMRARLSRLTRELRGVDAIAAFLGEIVDRSTSDPEQRGCMIVNTALEVAPHDEAVRAQVETYLDEIESFFRRALEDARAKGAIPDTLVIDDAARLLLAVVLAVRIAARARPQRERLEGMARGALASLGIGHPRH